MCKSEFKFISFKKLRNLTKISFKKSVKNYSSLSTQFTNLFKAK